MKVEILGKREDKIKMDNAALLIQRAALSLNIPVEITLTHQFAGFSGHSFNPTQTPIVFIDGHIEFAGVSLQLPVVVKKLNEIRSRGSQTF